MSFRFLSKILATLIDSEHINPNIEQSSITIIADENYKYLVLDTNPYMIDIVTSTVGLRVRS